MPRFLYLRMRPVWGYALRALPQSKTRVSLGVPPPTSLIGALAYPLARVLGRREETLYLGGGGRRGRRGAAVSFWGEELRGRLLYVGAALGVASAGHGSILKIQYTYRGDVLQGVAAMPVEVTAGSEGWIDAVYVFREAPWGWGAVERAAWGVSRLGSRESPVYVEGVWSGEASEAVVESARTRFSFYGVAPRDGEYRLAYVVDWRVARIGDYSGAPRVAAVYPRGYVEVGGPVRVYRLGLPWGVEEVVAGAGGG